LLALGLLFSTHRALYTDIEERAGRRAERMKQIKAERITLFSCFAFFATNLAWSVFCFYIAPDRRLISAF
jgi:hypothetical protein